VSFFAGTDAKDVSRLTLAEEAIVIADRNEGKLELHLRNGSTTNSLSTNRGNYSLSASPNAICPSRLAGSKPDPHRSPPYRAAHCAPSCASVAQVRAMPASKSSVACPSPLLAFPLLWSPCPRARPRRGGRAAGFLITLLLITGYYLMFTVGAGLARQGTLPVWAGIWSANALMAALECCSCRASNACRGAAGGTPQSLLSPAGASGKSSSVKI